MIADKKISSNPIWNLLGELEKILILSEVFSSICADIYLPINPDPPVISNIAVTFSTKLSYYQAFDNIESILI